MSGKKWQTGGLLSWTKKKGYSECSASYLLVAVAAVSNKLGLYPKSVRKKGLLPMSTQYHFYSRVNKRIYSVYDLATFLHDKHFTYALTAIFSVSKYNQLDEPFLLVRKPYPGRNKWSVDPRRVNDLFASSLSRGFYNL